MVEKIIVFHSITYYMNFLCDSYMISEIYCILYICKEAVHKKYSLVKVYLH